MAETSTFISCKLSIPREIENAFFLLDLKYKHIPYIPTQLSNLSLPLFSFKHCHPKGLHIKNRLKIILQTEPNFSHKNKLGNSYKTSENCYTHDRTS